MSSYPFRLEVVEKAACGKSRFKHVDLNALLLKQPVHRGIMTPSEARNKCQKDEIGRQTSRYASYSSSTARTIVKVP